MRHDGEAAGPREWDAVSEFMAATARLDPEAVRESFEAYLSERRERYPVIGLYADHGEWRDSSPHPDEAREYLDEQPFSRDANQCYYNAQTSIGPETAYAEGYAVQTNGGGVIAHAWLEHEGRVVELSPGIRRDRTDYYGVAFDHADVAAVMSERGHASPIIEAVRDGLISLDLG